MPLFSNQSNQSAATWEPQAADTRLAQTAGASPAGVFTSDLSVSEYVLLGEAGFEPLGFVIGSSIYHVGLQVGRWSQNQELQVLTQAMYNARELAMARMRPRPTTWMPTASSACSCGCRCTPGARVPGVRRDRHCRPSPGRHGRAPGARRAGLHLRLVRAGLLPAARSRGSTRSVRARHLRLPHCASERDAVIAPDRPEPGDGPVHAGCLRGTRARANADAVRSRAGSVVRHRRRDG